MRELGLGFGIAVALGCGPQVDIDDAGGSTAGQDTMASTSTQGSVSITVADSTLGDAADDFADDAIFDDGLVGDDGPPNALCGYIIPFFGPTALESTVVGTDLHGDGSDELYLIVDLPPPPDAPAAIDVQALGPPFEGDQWVVLDDVVVDGSFAGFHDIDGDGLRDLVVRAPDGPMGYPLMFHRLEGPGLAFAPVPTPILNPPMRQINFIQLDDDTIADILAVPDGGGALEAWFGDGLGNYFPDVTLSYPDSVAVQVKDARVPTWFVALPTYFADFGCANSFANSVQLFPGGALEGIFSQESEYAAVLDAADVDGNGFVDAYVRVCEDLPGDTEGFELLLADGKGMTSAYASSAKAWVGTADVDADGDVDYLWADPANGATVVELASEGTIGLLPGVDAGVTMPGTRALGSANVFGDGWEVLLLTTRTDAGRYYDMVRVEPCF